MNKTSRRAPAAAHGKQMPKPKAPAIAQALRAPMPPKEPAVKKPGVRWGNPAPGVDQGVGRTFVATRVPGGVPIVGED